MKKKDDSLIAKNPTAGRDFHILETIEAGISLLGSEVKSIRDHHVQLRDSFARIDDGRIKLYNMEVSPYPQAGFAAPEPKRPRILLLHKAQIARLDAEINRGGITLVPTKLYWKNGLVKVELGLARGKKQYDHREDIRKRDLDREMQRALKHRAR